MNIKKVEVLLKTKFLGMNCSHYLDNQGSNKKWIWAERPNLTSAVMVAATHGDKLVLIKEFRVPLNDYIWGLPAGLVEYKESPEETGVREVTEETGLKITKIIRPTSSVTYTSPGMSDERLFLMFAEVEGTPSTKDIEASEDIEVHLLSRVEVANVIQSRDKIDSKAYLIMLRFAEDGKI